MSQVGRIQLKEASHWSKMGHFDKEAFWLSVFVHASNHEANSYQVRAVFIERLLKKDGMVYNTKQINRSTHRASRLLIHQKIKN